MRVLVHTPISNRAWCLPEFWSALCQQIQYIKDGCRMSGAEFQAIMRFDVNDSQDQTHQLVQSYISNPGPFDTVQVGDWSWPGGPMGLSDHEWNRERYGRMVKLRNAALGLAAQWDCEYLFSLDSDVILDDMDTLAHLIASGKPVIAGVFMAKWGNPEAVALPNVWERGQNEMSDEFLEGIARAPAHVRVGGLGACTLIHKMVWRDKVSYSPVPDLPSNYRGEDRWFCVRAAVAGFGLWACAHKRIRHLDKTQTQPVRAEESIK